MKAKTVFLFLVALTLLRCVWVVFQAISPQEAYYWLCSQRLAAAFFDGPPGTAFVVRMLDGLGGPLFVARVIWPFFGLAAAWLVWLLAKKMYDKTVASWVVLALNALPVFNRAAVIVGPEMPALALALAGILTMRSAWDHRKNCWMLAGIFFAVAILFRYEAILIPAGVILALFTTVRHRTRNDFFGLATLAILIGVALWKPLVWNASLEWIPIAGGTFRSAWEFHLKEFFVQIGVLLRDFSVAFGLMLLAGVVWLAKEARLHGRARFLLAVCAPSWLWWLCGSLRGEDVTFAAMLGSVPVLIFIFAKCQKFKQAPLYASIAVAIALLSSGVMMWKISREVSTWPLVADQMRAAARDMPAGPGEGFFVAETPDLAAILSFYIDGARKGNHIFVPESPDISNQFAIWPSYADFVESDQVVDEYFTEQHGVNPFIGRSAIYVGHELPQTIKGAFEETRVLRRMPIPNASDLTIYLCLNYQTLPL